MSALPSVTVPVGLLTTPTQEEAVVALRRGVPATERVDLADGTVEVLFAWGAHDVVRVVTVFADGTRTT